LEQFLHLGHLLLHGGGLGFRFFFRRRGRRLLLLSGLVGVGHFWHYRLLFAVVIICCNARHGWVHGGGVCWGALAGPFLLWRLSLQHLQKKCAQDALAISKIGFALS
jgi:hypothetical protein